MNPTFLLVTLAFGHTAIARSGADSFDFKRTFKPNTKVSYTYKAGPHGEKEMFICQYTETITTVTADGANVNFTVVKLDIPGLGASDPVPPLTSKVGLDNMPAAANIKDSSEFVIFGCVSGITPNKSSKLGDKLKVHWQNDSKDVSFEGSGTIKSVDASSKTLSVDWNIQMTPSYTTGGTFKLLSTYNLADCSLVRSTGTFTIGQTVMDVNVTQDATAS
jgi:hypothetical protein